MNNNFDNGMNPVGGNPNPVPNNFNPTTNNVVDPNVNVVSTNPTYVDNSMVNNNMNPINSVPPVVDNTIASVDNNITDDNKKKPNKLVTLFLVVLAICVGIFAMNTDSIFFGSELDLVLEEDFETSVKEYVARQNEETELYTLYKVENNKLVVILKSTLDKDSLMRPEYQETYKISKDVKVYTYNCIYNYDESGNRYKEKETASQIDMELFKKYMTSGGYPAGYIEIKGNTIVQIVVFAPENLKERYQ